MEKKIQEAVQLISSALQKYPVSVHLTGQTLVFSSGDRALRYSLAGEQFNFERADDAIFISADRLISEPVKIAYLILSKLNLNTRVFARNCEFKKIDKHTAGSFLNGFHLMGATQVGTGRGLFYRNELLAVASFSKGRKMNRLPGDKLSFELIRYCSRPGITVIGGLTKLVKNFYSEKKAGDIMTYVDKQLSDGVSFVNAGFKKYGDTAPVYFLIGKKSGERVAMKDRDEDFDAELFYRTRNSGSIKMVYQPVERL